jgi:hypothetical protein
MEWGVVRGYVKWAFDPMHRWRRVGRVPTEWMSQAISVFGMVVMVSAPVMLLVLLLFNTWYGT